MTPNAAPLPAAHPHARAHDHAHAHALPGAPQAERRRSPAVFRGSLERRLPASSPTVGSEGLLPPVGRSEAFAEDLLEHTESAPAPAGARLSLRWLGLPVLAWGAGAAISLAGLGEVAARVGF